MKHIGTEREYQRYIIDYLVGHYEFIERKCKTDYDRVTAMDREMLFQFLDETQPDTMAILRKTYGDQTKEIIVKFIIQAIDNKGSSLIETLKYGIEIANMHLDLLYGKPVTEYNTDLVQKYNANRFSVMKEVWINDEQRMDLVVFVNGFAIASFELKCQNAGQNYQMAIQQYCEDRDSKNRLFLFKTGVLVNFAMDLDTCYMTTKLDGLGTRFIPFNRGCGEGVSAGAGNPLEDGVDDYPMHYMWDDILSKDSLIELITKFVFIQREQIVNERTGKKSIKEKLFFPRYHQRDAVRRLLADATLNGTRLNYLIEHSAGSGKTNTIAWLAHRLVSLHDQENHIVYDSVLVITDRVVVDRQLQDAIKSIDHKSGVVHTIDDRKTSADLADALQSNSKIIVTTIQKFLYVDFWKLVQNQNGKSFAIIIDEAHSSTSGKDMIAVKNTLGQNEGVEEADAQDAIENEIRHHGKPSNVSIFAFTATPKPMTLRLFGRESVNEDGSPVYQPFHLYSMKQAIEEGYILDVLQNYIEYKTYYQLNKTIEDDPAMKTIAAKRQIARFIDLFDDNINQRVSVIVEHFRSTVMQELGGKAKAMVITASRESAVKYRQALEDYVVRHNYKEVKALVAFSGKVKVDENEYTEPGMNGFAEEKLPIAFDQDEYNVLLVANKYQVGFDQPKLCAMYVLKKLRDVNAVQTLSRLNRICPPFDKKVVVIDFVNHAEEMEKAFAPYYTTTVLSNTATIAQLRELENRIEGYNVLDDHDVDTVAAIVYNPDGKRTTAKEDRKVYQCMQRAVNALKKQFDEDRQRTFSKNCRGFVRMYEFMSMASSFGDPELHKKYTFINLLLTYLVTGTSGGISLKDKIQATNFVQENQGDKGNKKQHVSEPDVKLAGTDIVLTVDEVKHLSEIIEEVNSRTGKDYDSDAMTKVMLQIKDLLLRSDELKTAAINNTEQDFEFSFYDNTDDVLIQGLAQNQDFFSQLLNNDDIKRQVLGVFLHEIYQKLREE